MKLLSLISCVLLLSAPAHAQAGGSKITWPSCESSFTKERMGQPFLQVDSTFRTIEGKTFNYHRSGKNTMVYFGMYGCPPCMAELPSVVSIARLHPEMNFVYTTYNEEQTVKEEFESILGKGYQLPENFHRVTMTQLFIALQNLTICYPVKYFLDREGVVRYMQYQELKTFNGKEYDDYFSVNQAVLDIYNK